MQCCSSSRRLLQHLYANQGLITGGGEPLHFLCPRLYTRVSSARSLSSRTISAGPSSSNRISHENQIDTPVTENYGQSSSNRRKDVNRVSERLRRAREKLQKLAEAAPLRWVDTNRWRTEHESGRQTLLADTKSEEHARREDKDEQRTTQPRAKNHLEVRIRNTRGRSEIWRSMQRQELMGSVLKDEFTMANHIELLLVLIDHSAQNVQALSETMGYSNHLQEQESLLGQDRRTQVQPQENGSIYPEDQSLTSLPPSMDEDVQEGRDQTRSTDSTSASRFLRTTSFDEIPEDFLVPDDQRILGLERVLRTRTLNATSRTLVADRLQYAEPWSYDWVVPVHMLQNAMLRHSLQQPDANNGEAGQIQPELIEPTSSQPYINLPITAIPIPKTWTTVSFAQYVADLTSSRVHRDMNSKLLKELGKYHHLQVQQALETALFIPKNAALLSATAFEYAAKFYCRYELLERTRWLHDFAREMGCVLSDQFYDIILRHAAILKDLSGFTAWLRRALESGFRPGQTTWASLAMCLRSDQACDAVIALMEKNKLITEPAAQSDLIHLKLKAGLRHQTDESFDILQIIERMDTAFGEQWFDGKTSHLLIKHLVYTSKAPEIPVVLKLMVKRGIWLSARILNLLLLRCESLGHYEAALHILKAFGGMQIGKANALTHNLLFSLAWSKHLLHTCQAIWSSACFTGNRSYKLDQTVLKSLQELTETRYNSKQEQWKKEAGKLIVGIQRSRQTVATHLDDSELASQESDSPAATKAQDPMFDHPENAIEMHKRNRQLHELFRGDTDLAFSRRFCMDRFVETLLAAYERDKAWIHEGMNDRPLEERRARMQG